MVLIQGLRNPLRVRSPRSRARNPLEGNGHQSRSLTLGLVLPSPSPTVSSAGHQTCHLTQGVSIPGPDQLSQSEPRLPPTWRASAVICSVLNGTKQLLTNKTTDTDTQSHHCSRPAQQTIHIPGAEARLEKMGRGGRGGLWTEQENQRFLVAAEEGSKHSFLSLEAAHI